MSQLIDHPLADKITILQTDRHLGSHDDFSCHPKHLTAERQRQLQQQFKLPQPLYLMQQQHGKQIVELKQPPQHHYFAAADACFTRQKNLICAVMTADCLPVLLYDQSASWVAAIHCGWRSLAQDILGQSLAAIKPNPEQTYCWLGPCIQAENYQVNQDLVNAFIQQNTDYQAAFRHQNDHKKEAKPLIYTDLCQLASIRLKQLGINKIHNLNHCTQQRPEYHSWRQNQSPYRMASLIWINC